MFKFRRLSIRIRSAQVRTTRLQSTLSPSQRARMMYFEEKTMRPPVYVPESPSNTASSLANKIITNTLNKVQELIMQQSGAAYEVIPVRHFQSKVEHMSLRDPEFVSFLRRHPHEMPHHIWRDLRQTYDSHDKLDRLLGYPDSPELTPQVYLSAYLKVRHNVSKRQLLRLLERLRYHRWSKNASIIIMENSKSIDEVLETSMELFKMIKSHKDDSFGINEFLVSFDNEALLPQLIRIYVTSVFNDRVELQMNKLKEAVKLGKFIDREAKSDFIFQYDSVNELADAVNKMAGHAPLELPSRLELLALQCSYIMTKYEQPRTRLDQLKDLINAELDRDQNLFSAPGAIARLVQAIAPSSKEELTFICDLLSRSNVNAADLSYIIRRPITAEQVEAIFQQYKDNGIKDISFITAVVDIYIKLGETRRVLQIVKDYEPELPLFYLGKVLTHTRHDLKNFLHTLGLIDETKHGYVLKAMSKTLCYEYSKSKKTENTITFDQIFLYLDALKMSHIPNDAFLRPLFHDILLDKEFIDQNKSNFEKNLARLTAKSRADLEMLCDWNYTLYSKFNETENTVFINIEFNRKLLIRILRLQNKERRSELLKQFGINLSILSPTTASRLVNNMLNSMRLERGKNVIDLRVAVAIFKQALDSYVECSMFSPTSLDSAYHETLMTLKRINIQGGSALNGLLKSNSKQLLMQRLVEHDHDLATDIIRNETDVNLIKGFLLGLISTHRLTPTQKMSRFDNIMKQKFYNGLAHRQPAGRKVFIALCNAIIDRLKEGELSRMTNPRRLLWALRQCHSSQVDPELYKDWYSQLEMMRSERKGYWAKDDGILPALQEEHALNKIAKVVR